MVNLAKRNRIEFIAIIRQGDDEGCEAGNLIQGQPSTTTLCGRSLRKSFPRPKEEKLNVCLDKI